jgi:predicted DCC family thiol-disulfide oxidoreductase YuxK
MAGLAFHVGSGVVLGIWFTSLMSGYACLVDWNWLGRRLTRMIAGQQLLLVIYDDSCEMCCRTIAILKTLDICGALVSIPSSSDDPRRLAHPEITDEMVLRDLYVVGDNYIAAGYDGYQKIATRMLTLWPLALIMTFPPVAAVGRRMYRRAADSRHCAIDEASPSPSAVGYKNEGWLALHVVGILLILGELTFAAPAFATQELRKAELPMSLRPSGQVASQVASRWRGRALFWPWPFDLYPTFTWPSDGSYRWWDLKLVSSDGSELSVPPEVFARALGDWATSSDVMANVIRNPTAAGHRASVARMLWNRLPESSRLVTVTIRGYDSVYSTDPDDVRMVRHTLIDNFPTRQLAADRNTLQPSRRNENLGPTIAVRP